MLACVMGMQFTSWCANLAVQPGVVCFNLTCCVDLQYRVVKKLRNEVLALKGDIDTLQRLQQENHQPDRMLSQQSM